MELLYNNQVDDFVVCVFLLISFLSGSVPFGLLLVRLAGKGDVRSVGSGNIGGTNVARAGGKWLGVLTIVLDASKGFFPVYFARHFGFGDALASFAALAAVLGHVFTPWLRFKGGKGVATALGAALAFNSWMILPSLAVFIVTVVLTRFVSLGSILGAFVLPVFLLIGLKKHSANLPLVFAVWMALVLLVIVKHYANIKRLLNGTENPLWGNKRKDRADE
ncbi:MAG: glycerol-3-phosphate 1-O-acyltransferase PlsY [Holophagales bacterium]|jgi:glycerol-3-phosphate acyltransferase PlsY|nr:glycerol-3-phosphate 1-O-acyltransferase PlsY [Holophagales bacterium]